MPENENEVMTEEETVETEPETEPTEPAESEIPEGDEPEPFPPGPTPEEEEEWEREREAAWQAKLAPFKAIKETIADHDDLMADALYEITMLELGMEE